MRGLGLAGLGSASPGVIAGRGLKPIPPELQIHFHDRIARRHCRAWIETTWATARKPTAPAHRPASLPGVD